MRHPSVCQPLFETSDMLQPLTWTNKRFFAGGRLCLDTIFAVSKKAKCSVSTRIKKRHFRKSANKEKTNRDSERNFPPVLLLSFLALKWEMASPGLHSMMFSRCVCCVCVCVCARLSVCVLFVWVGSVCSGYICGNKTAKMC